jgi:hypothetical protein
MGSVRLGAARIRSRIGALFMGLRSEGAHEIEHYVGLEISLKSTAICVIYAKG